MKLLPLKLPDVETPTILTTDGEGILTPEALKKYSNDAATLHFRAWGKYETERTLTQWKDNWLEDPNKLAVIIMIDDAGEIIGTASLKTFNMGDQFPDLSPWLSGLYVTPDYKDEGVDALLMYTIVQIAKAMEFETLYAFEHEIEKHREFYEQFGWTEYSEETAHPAEYFYKGEPILLVQGNVDSLIETMNDYFAA